MSNISSAVCRICLLAVDQPSSISVCIKIYDNKSILEVMQECSSIDLIEEDNLPKFICTICRDKLYSLYEFRNLIIKSDTQLKSQICIKKENIPNDENADNYSKEFLPWTLLKTEAEEEIDTGGDKYNEHRLAFDADLVKSIEENLKNLFPEERTIEQKVSEGYIGTKKKRIRLYKCKECNLEFKSAHSIGKHNQQQHDGEKPFSCEFCGKAYFVKSALKTHVRVHTGDKPYTCDVCQKSFGSAPCLYSHKKIHNEEEKRFFCEVCNKGFYHTSQLSYHMRLHTGEKPYMCEICSKMFRERGSLVRHLAVHQEAVEKVPCPICGGMYKPHRDLRLHMKRHTGVKPFACNVCGQRFTDPASERRHQNLHTGEKNYKCKVCEKSFSQNSILYRHMRIHSGEKPFHCKLCPKEFAYKHHLQGHVRIHHKDAEEDERGLDVEQVADSVS